MAGRYDVGYGKPPAASQFKPGHSGNPRGRPKGSRGISAVIASALSERVMINENGRRRSITKLEAAFKQMANKAASGDQRAAKLIIELLHHTEARDDARVNPGALAPESRRAADQAILDAIRDQVRGLGEGDQGL